MYLLVLQESPNLQLELRKYNVMSKVRLNQFQLILIHVIAQLTLLTFVKNKHHAQIIVDRMDFALEINAIVYLHLLEPTVL